MGADTTPQALVRVYEAEKDQWQSMTSMPTPRYGATPFVRGTKIYVMGRKCIMEMLYVLQAVSVTVLACTDMQLKAVELYLRTEKHIISCTAFDIESYESFLCGKAFFLLTFKKSYIK